MCLSSSLSNSQRHGRQFICLSRMRREFWLRRARIPKTHQTSLRSHIQNSGIPLSSKRFSNDYSFKEFLEHSKSILARRASPRSLAKSLPDKISQMFTNVHKCSFRGQKSIRNHQQEKHPKTNMLYKSIFQVNKMINYQPRSANLLETCF